ncbi:MAG TPA: ABC transporter ATP-binding protein [Acidimicrobiales bacterium]|nr:ABC transporter ATP-binding protein [Acidimicrobiales bacterium]
MSFLEVKGLNAGYGALPVLTDVSFNVEEGETAVLLGLNGAGKTTTVTSIAGLLKPWGGEIWFDGNRVDGKPSAELVKTGIVLVPEGRRCWPTLTVEQNLRLGSWTRKDANIKATLDRVFEYFPRVEERLKQAAGTLSGGEQQMVAIGRGLMAGPKLLLIDEASLGLSPLLAKTVFAVVDRIREDGTTVILVEQNIGALRHAQRALVMEKGALIYVGEGDELRDSSRLRETYLGAPA